ncbi:transcription initiation factor TFIID complex 60 kDa subunit [Abortiporus biennis]|nr:transcription initiation factor TFIID complex 60 kDa subunit [Abortiporus biennis]
MSTTNKQKAKAPHSQFGGLYKSETIRDVAESLNITSLSEPVASALASDVEYRIHQEAGRFMRHARRTTMTTSDIDQALRVLNIEPLYGHFPHNPPTFRKALPFPQLPAAGPVYFVEDEEIDFDRVIREEKITLPKGVSWTAHWLAVEGVQPLIPENPPAIPRETDVAPTKDTKVNGTSSLFPLTPPSSEPIHSTKKLQSPPQQPQQLVKQVLSRELQLYYNRLTTSLLPPTSDTTKRAAALASLRNDAGLQALLPYLVRWVGDGVVKTLKEGAGSDNEGRVLGVLLDVICAILDNSTLFVEPYLHQLLPPILSVLLHSSLPWQHSTHLRTLSAQTLSHLLTKYSTTYPSLSPRIMKTLLLALVSKGKSFGTREGAIRGLMGVGKEAVRKGLLEGGGARVVGSELSMSSGKSTGEKALVDAVVGALSLIHPPTTSPQFSHPETDPTTITRLREIVGDFFAERIQKDSGWTRGILAGSLGDVDVGGESEDVVMG